MEIKYYHLTYDDIEMISNMESKFFGQPWSASSIATYMEKGNTIFLVAKHDEKIAGYAAVMCVLDEGNLVSIAVDEEFRNLGIASELLDIAYEEAKMRGVTSINLEVRQSNTPAIKLYEKENFEQIGERKNFYSKPTEDAILFLKKLC